MRAGDRADDVMRVLDAAHPVAQGFVEGILEGLAAAVHLDHVGAHELHAKDIEALAADILGAHVDVALEIKEGRHGGGGHAVLAGAGLGDDAFFAHAFGKQALADGVVDLVSAGVVEVFALEIDPGSANFFGKPSREIKP